MSEPAPSTCEKCGDIFGRLAHLQTHVRKHHEGFLSFSCKDCGESVSSEADLDVHMETHYDKKIYGIRVIEKCLNERI